MKKILLIDDFNGKIPPQKDRVLSERLQRSSETRHQGMDGK